MTLNNYLAHRDRKKFNYNIADIMADCQVEVGGNEQVKFYAWCKGQLQLRSDHNMVQTLSLEKGRRLICDYLDQT